MENRLMRTRLFAGCIVLAVLTLFPSFTEAQSRQIEAIPLPSDQSIQLNGRLDEPIWDQAGPADNFLQREPLVGEPATEQTEVRVVYDRQYLYIGAMMFDSDPSGIIGFQKQRDASLFSDDRFMLILDTFRDGRTGYFFETNPAGLMGDALISPGERFGVNKSWDGIWEARVVQTDEGWSAEFRIPFSTMNFNIDNDTWGINFQRTIRRKNEETIWSGHLRNENFFEPIYAGIVTGLSGMSQGTGLEVKPYAIASRTKVPANQDPNNTDFDAGFDITYSVTPSLRASVTVNTDFAEVEVDDRQVNLTRFPIFFPEKRDFFLEGSSVFNFAPRNGASPYFSRRIGLAGGEQIPITYGARMAGQEGLFDIGFLHVRTAEVSDMPAENFTVARVKRNFGEQSSFGTIFTRRATQEFEGEEVAPDRYTAGADLELTTRRLFGDKNFNFQAFLVWHSENTFDEMSSDWDRTVRGIRFRYPNDPWTFQMSYREFGEYYRPAVGFVRRNGYKRIEPQFEFQPRFENSNVIREMSFGVAFEDLWSLDNLLLTQTVEVDFLGIEFESGDRLSFSYEYAFERLDREFNIYEDIVITPRDYRFHEWQLFGWTASRRKASIFARIAGGSFWDGTRTQIDARFSTRPVPGINASFSYERNIVDLPGGNFTTNVYAFEGGWQLSPWIAFNNIVQYDDVSERLTLFNRFRWTLSPGNDLYLVYTRNWANMYTDVDPDRFMLHLTDTGAAVKVNYTHRF